MTIPDSLSSYILCVVDLAIILPAAFMCLFPVRQWFLFSERKMFIFTFSIAFLYSLMMPFFGCGTTIDVNYFILPFAIVGLLFYYASVKLSKAKLTYVFLHATTALSFGGLLNCLVIDYFHPETFGMLRWQGELIQWTLSMIMVVYIILVQKSASWLLGNFDNTVIWLCFSFIPAVLTGLNVLMIPQNPSIMRQGRLFMLSLMLEGFLLVFFLFYQVVFYGIAQAVSRHYEGEKMTQLLEEQSLQYQSLQSYLTQSRRMQHDLRQVIRTIQNLAVSGEYEELNNFVQEFEKNSVDLSEPEFFCNHISLNATLGYYANLSKQRAIRMVWEIDVPAELSISDVEICTLFGNLLENAMNACEKVPEADRYIYLSADTNTTGYLYIVMINSCGSSRKSREGGVGLSSIKSTAEKYGGTAEFSVREKEFHSHVMLRL